MYYEREIEEQAAFGFRVDDLEADEVWAEAGELGEDMLNHYVEHYGKDDEWEVLVTEQPFQQLVLHPVTGDPWFSTSGSSTADGSNHISKKPERDHKTAKLFKSYLSLDSLPRATGLGRWTGSTSQAALCASPPGDVYNHLRKAFRDERPKDGAASLNKDGSVARAAGHSQPPRRSPRFDERAAVERRSWPSSRIQNIRGGTNADGSPPIIAYKIMTDYACIGHLLVWNSMRSGRLDGNAQFTSKSGIVRGTVLTGETR
jgi:hypothetical protein